MGKKLPKIYKGEDYSHVDNNKKTYCFDLSKNGENIESDFKFSVDQDYIINIPVKIETHEKTITSKIVSRVGDHIMTNTNQVIKLKDIKSIKRL